jgi:DNA modification methylase
MGGGFCSHRCIGLPRQPTTRHSMLSDFGVTGESTVSSGMNKDGKSGARVLKTAGKYGKRKNIWKYGVGGGKHKHPAVFPVNLAQDHIISWSNAYEVVFDPFMGSGTTGVACANLSRKFIGIELDESYFNIAQARINNAIEEHKNAL